MSKVPSLMSKLREIDVIFKADPYIITKLLYPAIEGKDINGNAIVGTYTYGDVHTATGLKYYYTDIKGSKPIKDPRIGAHFGSQRYKFKTLQSLEQETATHNKNVYSVDGREYIRAVADEDDRVVIENNNNGNYISFQEGSNGYWYLEIVGYFSDLNLLALTEYSVNRNFIYKIDGGSNSSVQTTFGSLTNDQYNELTSSRYVDRDSVATIVTGQTLGIHTFTMRSNAATDGINIYGCELIVQDITSSATRSQIQIPTQDVVTYGNKVEVRGSTQHYDPFNGFVPADSWSAITDLDTTTSLGLEKWKFTSNSNYYRPFNGGRIVKWVDSNGAIKTSVTMMPPNAKSVANLDSLTDGEKIQPNDTNQSFYPKFETHTTSVNDDLLSEAAKTFHWREFGNGSANAGAGSANWPDASMLDTTNAAIAYVMDDGLTSFVVANGISKGNSDYSPSNPDASNGYYLYITFIGTGLSITSTVNPVGGLKKTIVQNLPYGTHVYKHWYMLDNHSEGMIDGIVLGDTMSDADGCINKITFHQPKMPPIPEKAVIIADYMLMADFVPQANQSGTQYISKGVRRQNISRDVFVTHENLAHIYFQHVNDEPAGFKVVITGDTPPPLSTYRIPSFGTNYVHIGLGVKLFIDTTDNDSNATTGVNYSHLTSDITLGSYKFGANPLPANTAPTSAFDIATPIHTSSHYKTFETQFLYELVGGDRNMEQNNLVVTADGKTWDEVTRDTSYIGNNSLRCGLTKENSTENSTLIWDEWRGKFSILGGISPNNVIAFNKDFAIANDRFICLRNGLYDIKVITWVSTSGRRHTTINLNDNIVVASNAGYASYDPLLTSYIQLYVRNGDNIRIGGAIGYAQDWINNISVYNTSFVTITRV
jgi:hypothetical protein